MIFHKKNVKEHWKLQLEKLENFVTGGIVGDMGFMKASTEIRAAEMREKNALPAGRFVTEEKLHWFRVKAWKYYAAREHEMYKAIKGRGSRERKRAVTLIWWQQACMRIRANMTPQEIRDEIRLIKSSLSRFEIVLHADEVFPKFPYGQR
jgi:hypothetical protein